MCKRADVPPRQTYSSDAMLSCLDRSIGLPTIPFVLSSCLCRCASVVSVEQRGSLSQPRLISWPLSGESDVLVGFGLGCVLQRSLLHLSYPIIGHWHVGRLI